MAVAACLDAETRPPGFAGLTLQVGGYRVDISRRAPLVARAQALRARAFGMGGARDTDRFDAGFWHGLVTRLHGGGDVMAFRLRALSTKALSSSYTGQFYDLSPLATRAAPMVELGRVCTPRGGFDPNAMRLAWAAVGAFVDAHHADMLIGCSSFPGADPARHAGALACLRARHLGPPALRPGKRARETAPFPTDARPDPTALPPLLRGYLSMGGWVGDHAVLDHALDTLHVFTGLELAAMPAPRKRRLREIAARARLSPLDDRAPAP